MVKLWASGPGKRSIHLGGGSAGAYLAGSLLLAGGAHHGEAAARLLPLGAEDGSPLGGEDGALHCGSHREPGKEH